MLGMTQMVLVQSHAADNLHGRLFPHL